MGGLQRRSDHGRDLTGVIPFYLWLQLSLSQQQAHEVDAALYGAKNGAQRVTIPFSLFRESIGRFSRSCLLLEWPTPLLPTFFF